LYRRATRGGQGLTSLIKGDNAPPQESIPPVGYGGGKKSSTGVHIVPHIVNFLENLKKK